MISQENAFMSALDIISARFDEILRTPQTHPLAILPALNKLLRKVTLYCLILSILG